eukprot:TRINITY_DN12238_c1_g1_i3.p1 TRINITY_DN12238_c1_g1~~TRINITY_DN12238_c1_g1_i3.p1  ORF type:complete len:315 (+),score=93.82 TRINITY_DN12238_c1_g1_i3:92-1036(+)
MSAKRSRSKRGPERVELPKSLQDMGFKVRAGNKAKDEFDRAVCVWLLPNSHPVTSNDQIEVLFESGALATLDRADVEERMVESSCAPYISLDKARARVDEMESAKRSKTSDKNAKSTSSSKSKGKKGKSSSSKAAKVEDESDDDTGELVHEEEYEVEQLLDKRIVRMVQYKVRWKGDWGEDKETWENVNNVDNQLAEEFELQRRAAGITERVPKEENELRKQLLLSQAANKELTWRLKLLLQFLEPVGWRNGDRAVANYQDEQFPSFPVADFMDVYTSELNNLIQRKVRELEQRNRQDADGHVDDDDDDDDIRS